MNKSKFLGSKYLSAIASLLILSPVFNAFSADGSISDLKLKVEKRAEAAVRRSDNLDGTYTNPPLYADFPDPDIIRVGEDFFFATTTFANTPGLTILHSKDLVNWQYLSHVVPELKGRGEYNFKNGDAYRSGVFAPSLRYYKGVFYVVVTPVGQNTRIYKSKDPRGPWSYDELNAALFDPGFFVDEDGKGYIATSGGWDGTVTLATLNEEFTKVTNQTKVHFNEGAEGSKLIKKGKYYYLFNSIPRRLGLTVSRATNLFGPWETRNQIDDTTGGHQGALVDLADGTYYGFVMIDVGSIGRMTNISPIFWQDDWPVWGTPDEPGRVPAKAKKPVSGFPFTEPDSSDDFSSKKLGLQWQWNHNPINEKWSLTERPGYLRLHATTADGFWHAPNTLTQKGQGPRSRGVIKVDSSGIKEGDVCGFGTLGKFNGGLSITSDSAGKISLSMSVIEHTVEGLKYSPVVKSEKFKKGNVWLRTDMDFEKSLGSVAYSLDGKSWKLIGDQFKLAYDWQTGTFQGEQFAIYCFTSGKSGGYLDVDTFKLTTF